MPTSPLLAQYRTPVALALLLAACATGPEPAQGPAPVARNAARAEAPPPDAGRRVVATHGAVASANALASQAGVEVLEAGGNAVDAAVATAFAIGVVEPEMSGLAAGGAMTIWLAGQKRPYYLDFYSAQNAARMRGATGPYQGPEDLRVVAIPGDVAGLLEAHRRFGRLPLPRVMQPAIRLARSGYPVGQILAGFIAADSAKLHRFAGAAESWWPGGRALAPGETFRNPALASTLSAIATGGSDAFYTGDVARAIVRILNAHGHPATLQDLVDYRPQWKRPLCTDYRGLTLISAPPPQTGMQVLETLELLEPDSLRRLGLPTHAARAFDALASALRVGQADAAYNDDPRWADVPARGVISARYAAARRALVGSGQVPDSVTRGPAPAYDDAPPPADCASLDPWPARAAPDAGAGRAARGSGGAAPGARPEPDGETTHMSVVDADGNAVALTQTNSSVFGSGAWVPEGGFFLNDSGYLWRDSVGEMPATTTWRTRNSTISPTIVLRGDSVRLVIGAPGGGRIPTEIAQVMVYIVDYGMDPLDAVRMPRIYPSAHSREVQLEHGFAPELLHDIRAMGWRPVPESFGYARLYLVARVGDHWVAVSDPRHDGEPRGY